MENTNKISKKEAREIALDGIELNNWIADLKGESNGVKEYLFAYQGKFYLVQTDRHGLEFGIGEIYGATEVDAESKIKKDDHIGNSIKEYQEQTLFKYR